MSIYLQTHNQATISQLKDHISSLETCIKAKDKQISDANSNISALMKQLQQEKKENAELKCLIQLKQREVFEAGTQNLAKDNVLEQKQQVIQMLTKQISLLKAQVERLKESLTPSQKNILLSQLKPEESDWLQSENKRLKEENQELTRMIKLFRDKDTFLSDQLKAPKVFQLPHETINSSHSILEEKCKSNHSLSEKEILPEDAQPKEAQSQAPKKRKLLRKHRIQADADDFSTQPING